MCLNSRIVGQLGHSSPGDRGLLEHRGNTVGGNFLVVRGGRIL